jgi:hypothetical protein
MTRLSLFAKNLEGLLHKFGEDSDNDDLDGISDFSEEASTFTQQGKSTGKV